MYKLSTAQWRLATVLFSLLASDAALAQQADWRHIGNTVLDQALAGPATGPVKRVWYGTAGVLFAQTRAGRVYQTADLENWHGSTAAPPPPGANTVVPRLPEEGAQTRAAAGDPSRIYAFGSFVYRSDDGGAHWENVIGFRGASLIGVGLADLVIAPGNGDEIVTAGVAGVFRSADGGRSWSGLNEGLPNLPATRLLNLPAGDQGVRIALENDAAVAWPPGNKQAWIAAGNGDLILETQLRRAISVTRGMAVTALTIAGNFVYTGMQNGEIRVSADRGVSWQTFTPAGGGDAGPVERFWVDPQDPRVALAALGPAPDDPFRASAPVHVLHTVNGGAFWDNFTANLPDAAAHGVAADSRSGALYAATDAGVFMAYTDLNALGAVESWTALPGLPDAPAMDVKLDGQANQLWVAVAGYGVYSTLAPHRLRDPSVVSAADLIARAVAPGR